MSIAQDLPSTSTFPVPGRGAISRRLLGAARTLGWAGTGAIGALAVWQAAAAISDIPGPAEGLRQLATLLWSPFYKISPNDMGIARHLGISLQRVGLGFTFAAIVGVPLGLLIGANHRAWMAINPLVQMLRPVSPLVWYPIFLIGFRNVNTAAVWVIFITALWPMVLNAAAGAGGIPQDQRRVAAVFKFGRIAYVRHILIPNALPSIVTGMRLSMGIGWMVIVAAEMLAGGAGIGGFVWNQYNAGNTPAVMASVLIIGTVGLVLDFAFLRLARSVAVTEAH